MLYLFIITFLVLKQRYSNLTIANCGKRIVTLLLSFFVDFNCPVDIERKLNVHKTFRRRPGRLLSVLCTFNLRPVSTG